VVSWWRLSLVFIALRRLKQENPEFGTSLDHILRTHLKKTEGGLECSSVAEFLPSTHKTPDSIQAPKKKRKKRGKEGEKERRGGAAREGGKERRKVLGL
jgi:hypothetical protein